MSRLSLMNDTSQSEYLICNLVFQLNEGCIYFYTDGVHDFSTNMSQEVYGIEIGSGYSLGSWGVCLDHF